MKIKLFIILSIIVNLSFSARMIINNNGVENIKMISEGDMISFSENGDTLYYTPEGGTIENISLKYVNRILLDTLGGVLTDFIIKTGDNEDIIDFNDVHRLFFELGNPDTITDSDGDGLSDYDEMYRYGTNPENPNTDGDIYDDGVEVHQFGTLWPLVAELPSFGIRMETFPIITFNYTYSSDNSVATEVVRGNETSTTKTNINMTETCSGYEHGWEVAVKVGQSFSPTSATDFGYKMSWDITASASGNYSHSETHKIGTENSVEYSKSIERAESRERTDGVSVDAGELSVDFKITNSGKFEFNFTSLTFEIITMDRGTLEKVTEIATTASALTPITVGIDQSVTIHGTLKMDMELAKVVRKQIADADHIFGQVGTYNVEYDGRSLDEASTQTTSNCATVIIDFGPTSSISPIERRVSALVNYNRHGDLDYSPLILNEALDAIKREFKGKTGLGPVLWWETSKIGDRYYLNAIGMDNERIENDSLANAFWYIIHNVKRDGLSDTIKTYNYKRNSVFMDTVSIGFGDIIHLVFSKDSDNDTLSFYEEEIYGSDDTKVDTDGDGLSDYQEVDGFKRFLEGDSVLFQTNPVMVDTDGDGINDKDDPNPLRKPSDHLATHAYLDSILFISNTNDTVYYNSVSNEDTVDITLNKTLINADVSFVTDSVASKVDAMVIGGLSLGVAQTKSSLKAWDTHVVLSDVETLLRIVNTSENGEHLDTIFLKIYSPLANSSEITNLAVNSSYPWKMIDIKVDNSNQDNSDERTTGVLLLRSRDSSDLASFALSDNNNDADAHDIGKRYPVNGSSYGVFVIADTFNITSSFLIIDDLSLRPGKKYHYLQMPYYTDGDNHHWYADGSIIKDKTTKRVEATVEFRKYKVVDEGDGAGLCEIEHRFTVFIKDVSNNTVNKTVICSGTTENLDDDDWVNLNSKKDFYLDSDEELQAKLFLVEDDGSSGDDSIWSSGRNNDLIFPGGGQDAGYYNLDFLGDRALNGGISWQKGSEEIYYKNYIVESTNDATIKVYLYIFADIVD